MRFGLNFFPSFRPQDSTTADYYQQCLRISERADALGYSSIKTVEHSFYDYGGRRTGASRCSPTASGSTPAPAITAVAEMVLRRPIWPPREPTWDRSCTI